MKTMAVKLGQCMTQFNDILVKLNENNASEQCDLGYDCATVLSVKQSLW